jgi:4-amino-4-deoxy-L-arabinose transferase-like glycosyltransferase
MGQCKLRGYDLPVVMTEVAAQQPAAVLRTGGPRRSEAPALIGIMLLALLVFLGLIGRREIATSHEARVAQTARQMAVLGWPWEASARVSVPVVGLVQTSSGKRLAPIPGAGAMTVNPWLVPVINGQIRLQKPPLPYWTVAVLDRLTGADLREGVHEGIARIPSALIGVIGTLLIYDLARRLLGRRTAIVAAAVWVSTHFIVDEYRKAMADPYLALFTLGAAWAWTRACASAHCRWPALHIVLFYVSLGLGVLAKGPVIFVTALPAVLIFNLVCQERFPRPLWAHAIGLLLFLALAAPWPMYVMRHVPNALELWQYESVGELGENQEKARPWWVYAAASFQLALPWTPLWIAGIVLALTRGRPRRRSASGSTIRQRLHLTRRGKARVFALTWLLFTISFFSLAHVKKNAYLLPVIPAFVLLTADAIAMLLGWARRTRFANLPGVGATVQAAIGIGIAAVVLSVLYRMREPHADRVAGIVAALIALIVAASALREVLAKRPGRWFAIQTLAYALVLFALIGFERVAADNARSPKPFARAVARLLWQPGTPPLLVRQLPEEVSAYLPLNLPDGSDADRVLVVVDDNRLEIPRGRKTPEDFIAPLIEGGHATAISRVPVDASDGGGRWQLYEVLIDRTRA